MNTKKESEPQEPTDIEKRNARYNMKIMDEVISNLKKTTKWSLISKSVRDRVIKNGELDKSKIEKLTKVTGIEDLCFTGGKRFIIPNIEADIIKKPDVLKDINTIVIELPNLMSEIRHMVDICRRGESIHDENLERFIHFAINEFSTMKNYRRYEYSLYELTSILKRVDNNDILKSDIPTLTNFIEVANAKLTIAKAGLIMKKGID